jgi:hypothetical protein
MRIGHRLNIPMLPCNRIRIDPEKEKMFSKLYFINGISTFFLLVPQIEPWQVAGFSIS